MKATNQKDQTVEILKFSGILLVSMLLMGFAFFGGTSVLPRAEKDNLQARITELQDSLRTMENRDKRMAAVLYYADSLYKLLEAYNKLEQDLINLRTATTSTVNPLAEDQALQIKAKMDEVIKDMRTVQDRLREDRYQEGIPYLPANLVSGTSNNFVKALDIIIAEKKFKRLTLLGNSSNMASLEEENEKLQEELALERTKQQYESQISTLQGASQDCSGKLASCEASLAAKNGLLLQCKSTLSVLGPGMLTHSTNLTTHTTALNKVVNDMTINNKNKKEIQRLIGEYNKIADQLLQAGQQMNGLAAKLE